MSASRPGNMRGPWVKTPLLLLLLITLTGTALCQEEGDDVVLETEQTEEAIDPSESADVRFELSDPLSTVTDSGSPPTEDPVVDAGDTGSGGHLPSDVPSTQSEGVSTQAYDTTPAEGEQNLGLIVIPILAVLVVVIIGMIVCGIVISRRWTNKARNQALRKEDPYLDGSSTEKVPMPMFEEDVPSVLELEMEELDQWMIKDGETAGDSNHM